MATLHLVPSRSKERISSAIEPPAGKFFHPDDIEAMESAQDGFKAGGAAWIDASRGMHRKPTAVDEVHVRSFWRQWHANIMGLDKAGRFEDAQGSH